MKNNPLTIFQLAADTVNDKFQESDCESRLKATLDLTELFFAVEQNVFLAPPNTTKVEDSEDEL